jgi:signal peptidase II
VSPRRAWARAGVVLAGVLAADQITKRLVDAAVPRGGRESLALGVDLVNVRNRGVAFGALADGGALVAVVVALALLALLAFFARNAHRPLVWLPTGLLLGGALGNLVDRLRLGAVVDFVKVPHWPAFNLADVSITVGVAALVWVLEVRSRRGAHGPA